MLMSHSRENRQGERRVHQDADGPQRGTPLASRNDGHGGDLQAAPSRKRKAEAAPVEEKKNKQKGVLKKTRAFRPEELDLVRAYMAAKSRTKYKKLRDPILFEYAVRTGFRRLELAQLRCSMLWDCKRDEVRLCLQSLSRVHFVNV